MLVLVLVLVLLSTAAPTLALGPNQFERFLPREEDYVQGVQHVQRDPGFGVPARGELPDLDRHDASRFGAQQPRPESYDWQQQHYTPLQDPQDMANFGSYPIAGFMQPTDNHYATNQHDGMFPGGVPAPSMVYQPYEHYEHGQAQSVPLGPWILGGSGVPAGPRSHARQSVASGCAQLRPQQEELGTHNAIKVSSLVRESGGELPLWRLKKQENVHVKLAQGDFYFDLSSYRTPGGELFTRSPDHIALDDPGGKYRAVSATKEERQAVMDIINFRLRGDNGQHQLTTPHEQYEWQTLAPSDHQRPEGPRARKKYVQLKINFNKNIRDHGRPPYRNEPISAFLVDDRLVLFMSQQQGIYYAAAFPLKFDERKLLMFESEKPERFAWVLGTFHEQRT